MLESSLMSGNFSTKEKIRGSGLWQEHHLWKKPLSERELLEIEALIKIQ
jgi:hypothetical protein